jgi:LPXTG-site transpeptidase (sortase) family protein
MTDPELHSGRRDSRRGPILVAAVAVVVIAVGLVIVAGGGAGSATPTPPAVAAQTISPAFTDLILVTVPPTTAAAAPTTAATVAPASTPASASGSAPPSAVATPAAEGGIPASRIQITRLGIDLRVVEGDGIDAPIGKAAHYPGSAWPGGGSNIFIYGHARVGMFLNLWKAREGDVVELGLVDGTTRTYVVDQVLPTVPWNAVKYLRPTATEQLTLQTSTSYHPTSPRFIVIAHPSP